MAYSQLTITAPESAIPGGNVSVPVKIKNVSSSEQVFRIEFWILDQSSERLLGTKSCTLAGGASRTYYITFTMPDSEAKVFVWVERWNGSGWSYDTSDTKTISISPPVGEAEFRNLSCIYSKV
jgi:hypothetical protein